MVPVRRNGGPRQVSEIDMLIVRENTEGRRQKAEGRRQKAEGEYSSINGRLFAGAAREIVMQETDMFRVGVDRVLRYVFEVANARPRKYLTSATKSNGIAITMPYWDERVVEMAKVYR